MKILGCDPGVHGGIAIVEINDGTAPRLVDAIDIPVTGVGAKDVWTCSRSAPGFSRITRNALIERAQAMPKQGASSGFKYGRAVGALEGVLACCEIPMTIVEPSAWKKFYRLRGGDKEGGRQRALQLFPAAHAWLARKKDHGRADAALVALYGAHQMALTGAKHAA